MSIQTIHERSQVEELNGALIRHCLERVYSNGELSLVNQLVAPDFVGESNESSAAHLGTEGVKAHVIQLRRTLNGFTITVDGLRLEGDTFEVSWTACGAHERRFLGIDPTCNIGQAGEEPHGNRIAVAGLTTGTISDGKIKTFRMSWDVEALRHQLASPVKHGDTPVDSFDAGHVSGVTGVFDSSSSERTSGMGRDSTAVGVVRNQNVDQRSEGREDGSRLKRHL